jgi:hypothetical protein
MNNITLIRATPNNSFKPSRFAGRLNSGVSAHMRTRTLPIILFVIAASACASHPQRPSFYALSVEAKGELVYGPTVFKIPIETTFSVSGSTCQNDKSIPLTFHVDG